jgi:Carbohydrate binding domain.
MTREKAMQLRRLIEKAAVGLSDPDALEGAELFPAWSGNGTAYAEGERVRYGGILYRCLQAHVSQADWSPDAAPSLWARVMIPDPEVIPEWEQPDSTNPYSKGDKVRHNGRVWVSDLDGNVWEPGVYGWTEAEEQTENNRRRK